jgi:hypothetical protein
MWIRQPCSCTRRWCGRHSETRLAIQCVVRTVGRSSEQKAWATSSFCPWRAGHQEIVVAAPVTVGARSVKSTIVKPGKPGFSIGPLVRSRGFAPSRRGAMHPVVDDQGQSFVWPVIWPIEPPEHNFTALLARVRVKNPSLVIDVDEVIAGWFWVVVCHLSVLCLL